MRDNSPLIALAGIIGLLAGYLIGTANYNPPPRLIGIDCFGASGPIYANEEDHFPACRSVERN